MAIRKVIYKITSTATVTPTPTIGLQIPSSAPGTPTNCTMLSNADGNVAGIAAAMAAAINAANVTSKGKPVKASSDGSDLYVAMLMDPATDPSQFLITGGSGAHTAAGNWSTIVAEDPWVDPTAGFYSQASLLTAMTGAFAAAKLVK